MKRILTPRALLRFRRISITFSVLLIAILAIDSVYGIAPYLYNDKEYDQIAYSYFDKGYIMEFTNRDEFCHSFVIYFGVSLFNEGILACFYAFALFYMFLGIAIVSDIFMGAIEVITSTTRTIPYRDKESGQTVFIQVLVWNPTIANLTLMALGSSAPEILLSCIETVSMLGSLPGELGPSTIVGSAAFNLLVISAVSIISVGDPPKKIDDLGVFAVTCSFSLFAYIWLYVVL